MSTADQASMSEEPPCMHAISLFHSWFLSEVIVGEEIDVGVVI